jgi:hypothetical protein
MFAFLKRFFATEAEIEDYYTETQGETDMFVTIEQGDNAEFMLVNRDGNIINSYSRRRDAVRGATRRGLTVIA